MKSTTRLAITALLITLCGASATAQGSWEKLAGSAPLVGLHVMAYDEDRNRVVSFGGYDDFTFLPDTWEWDGFEWERVAVAGPAPRNSHAMAYDPIRRTVILFGGWDSNTVFHDMWEWDGVSWSQISTALPPARTGHTMTLDSTRNRVVLFGGTTPTGALSDTWEWDGSTWHQIPTPAGTGRYQHNAAFDPLRGRVVVFGGFVDSFLFPIASDDTMEWDGSTWVQLTPTAGPSPRHSHAMAYDARVGRIVLQGGFVPFNTPTLSDTWEWDGATWTNQSQAVRPIATSAQGMVYDTQRNQLLMHGGRVTSSFVHDQTWSRDANGWVRRNETPQLVSISMVYDDVRARAVAFGWGRTSDASETWEWDGRSWTLLGPTLSPSVRHDAKMVFDTVRGRSVLFGGRTTQTTPPTYYPETWAWDGTTWSLASSTGPSGRTRFAMAYDSSRDRIVLFGGFDGNSRLGDTWEWDGTSWTQIATTGPAPCQYPEMVYDERLDRVVLFGGYDGSTYRTDTWHWDGAAWLRVATTGPAGRREMSLAYDPGRRRTVLLGGVRFSPPFDEVWEWDGVNWTLAGNLPAPISSHASTYDRARERLITTGRAAAAHVWEYTPTTPIGRGCGGTVGQPRLRSREGRPQTNTTFQLEIAPAPSSSAVFGAIGFAAATPPVPLDAIGMRGCSLFGQIDATQPVPNNGGIANWNLPIAAAPSLAGLQVFLQGLILDPGANSLGVSVTNGAAFTVVN